MDTATALSPPETVSASLRMIVRGWLAALGAWGLEPVLAFLLYRRINEVMGRIERILVRFRAGRLWRFPHRKAAPGRVASRKHEMRLPRRFGWLVQLGGHQAAGFASQLQTVLHTPEMVELLAASAQAGRILRPLCRALAVELPGVSGAAAKVCGAMRIGKVRPREAPEPFHVPLPRGVLVAARRAGFGKGR